MLHGHLDAPGPAFMRCGCDFNKPVHQTHPAQAVPESQLQQKTATLRKRFQPATVTAATMPRRQISANTVRRRLRGFGIRARRPFCGPILQVRHRQARLRWARQHLN